MQPNQFYKLLSDETRLKCLGFLLREGELCVCELMEILSMSQPKISRHLAELRKLDLVECERRGKWIYYRLHPDLAKWRKKVIELTVANNVNFYN